MPEGFRGFGGGFGFNTPNLGGFSRYDPTTPLLPSLQELEQGKREIEQNQGRGILGELFLGIEKLFLSQAIKGGVRGAAPGGEGFWEGFKQGLPFRGDDFRETNFMDIRRAFGDQTNPESVPEHVANFFANFAGELILAPLELVLNPLGKVGAIAGKTSASFAKAVQLGERMAVTFRVPFTGWYLGGTNLGLKSVATTLGKGVDNVLGTIRTAPGIGPISRFFTGMPNIFDPEKAMEAKRALDAAKRLPDQLESEFWRIYNQNVSPETHKFLMSASPQYNRALLTMQELGLKTVDQAGTISHAIDHADLWMRQLRRERMLKTDPKFAKLWSEASVLDKNIRTPEALDAVRKIYKNYDNIPLPEKWLLETGLTPREGAELSLFSAPTLTKTVTDLGLPATGKEVARRAITGTPTADVFKEATKKTKEEVFDLLGAAKKGDIKQEWIDEALQAHRVAMEHIANSEAVSGILNQSFEYFAGPYAYRVLANKGILEHPSGTALLGGNAITAAIDPEIKKLVHSTFLEGVKELGGDEALNYVGRFMRDRTITDLPTVVANAVAYQIGLKATGHIPVKELGEHGAQAVWSRIFSAKRFRQFYKVDPDLGEFFRIFPVHNDLMRYRASAEAMRPVHYLDEALHKDSTLYIDSFKLKDTEALGKWIGDPSKRIFLRTGKGWAFPSHSEVAETFVGMEEATRVALHKHIINEQVMGELLDGRRTYTAQMGALAEQLKLKSTASRAEIDSVRKNGGLQITRAIGDVQEAEQVLKNAQELQELWKLRRSKKTPELGLSQGGTFKKVQGGERRLASGRSVNEILNDPTLNAKLDSWWQNAPDDFVTHGLKQNLKDALELVATRNETVKGVKNGLKSMLDDMREIFDLQTKGFKGEMAATKEAFAAKKQITSAWEDSANAALDAIKKSRNPAQFNDELIHILKHRQAGVLSASDAAQQQIMKTVKLPDGSVAKIPDGTLLDKIRERFPDSQAYVLHAEDADAVLDLYNNFRKPDGLRKNGLIRGLDRVKSIWSAHTVLNPAFLATRARDVFQSQVALFEEGLGGAYGHWKAWEAGRALRDGLSRKAGFVDAFKGRTIGGLPMGEVIERMQQRGAIGSAMFRDEISQSYEALAYQLKKGGKAVEWVKDIPTALGLPVRSIEKSPILQVGYRFATHLDDHMRVSGVFNAIKNGAGVDEAIDYVSKVLYDSRRIGTNLERATVGRFIPFWTFKHYAIGRTFQQMFAKPINATWFHKMQNLAFASTPVDGSKLDPAVIDTILPQYIKEGLGIPYRNTKDGPAFALFGSYLTLGEVAQLGATVDNIFNPDKTAGDSVERYIGMQLHPVLRLAGEFIRNKEYFNDRPLEQPGGETVSFFGLDIPRKWEHVLSSIRMLNELGKWNIFNNSEAQAMLRAVRDNNVELPAFEKFMGSAFSPLPIPRARVLDATNNYRHRQIQDSMQYSELKARLRRKIEKAELTGEPLSAEDVEEHREAMIRKGAEIQVREDIPKSYSIDEIMKKRVNISKGLRQAL